MVAQKPKRHARRTFGADEAGRGPILGPMAIAVVGLDRRAAISLSKRGVADSKGFGSGVKAQRRRAELAEMIRTRATTYALRIVSAQEVDRYTFRGQLNGLERTVVRELLTQLGVQPQEKIFCDGEVMFAPLRDHFPSLVAVNNGEAAHVSVAAASVVAKDARDRAFAEICTRYESEFGTIGGGGYLNTATRRFLDAYRNKYGKLPPEARKSWGAQKLESNLDLFPRA